jgi:hypothetical protein
MVSERLQDFSSSPQCQRVTSYVISIAHTCRLPMRLARCSVKVKYRSQVSVAVPISGALSE